jgi:hypothetical protein
MRLSLKKTLLWQLTSLLLVCVMLLACSLLSGSPKESPTTVPDATTPRSGQGTEIMQPTGTSDDQGEATVLPAVDTATTGPYTLAVSNRYPFFEKKVSIAQSLTARAGQLWVGTISGTIEEVDPQTGSFGKSISLASDSSGGAMPMVYPIQKLAFEGEYLWVHAGFFEGSDVPPGLFALDPDTGEVVQEWDLNSPEWMRDYERLGEAADFGFGVSPGKIWIDSHIVDTQTFEVTKVSMPTAMTLYTYDGKEWMWITGELGGSCDDLILINVNDPTTGWCEEEWPFFSDAADGMSNPMVRAGDKIWMAGSWGAPDGSPYVLEAYPADVEQGMQTTGPLLSVPSPDSESAIKLFYAGDQLWVLDTVGDKMGWLFQVDPQTGETINSLDLVGDENRAIGDVPVDIATESDNLWVLTARQLLRIKLP